MPGWFTDKKGNKINTDDNSSGISSSQMHEKGSDVVEELIHNKDYETEGKKGNRVLDLLNGKWYDYDKLLMESYNVFLRDLDLNNFDNEKDMKKEAMNTAKEYMKENTRSEGKKYQDGDYTTTYAVGNVYHQSKDGTSISHKDSKNCIVCEE